MSATKSASQACLRLAQSRDAVADSLARDPEAVAGAPRILARGMDSYFRGRLEEAKAEHLGLEEFSYSLLAVGGYGRSEVCPASDVDALLLVVGSAEDSLGELATALFHPLWDMGLELGHGVRTVKECLALAEEDHKVLASLLDARFLAGDQDIFKAFFNSLTTSVLVRRSKGFLDRLAMANHTRISDYGDGPSDLEPELKNGAGGLRDYHQARWLSLMASGKPWPHPAPPLRREDVRLLNEDARWMLGVRTALHSVLGRKRDRLYLEVLPDVAALIMPHLPRGDAAREVLARTHEAMARIKAARQSLFLEFTPLETPEQPSGLSIRRTGIGLAFSTRTPMREQKELSPALMLKHSATGEILGWPARRVLEKHGQESLAALVDQGKGFGFLSDLLDGEHAGVAVATMFETGAMQGLIPESSGIANHIQFDAVHAHPGGVHTATTVARMKALMANEQPDPEPLIPLAGALLHDMGKGLPGSAQGHCRAGEAVAREVLARLGAPEDFVEETAFLVRNHLLLFKTATRLDPGDEVRMAGVASRIESPERLRRLHLLARADAMATGPKAWNPWFKAMLEDVRFKLGRLLAHGPMSDPAAAGAISEARDQTRSLLGDLDHELMEGIINDLPPRYFLMRDKEARARDVRLIIRMDRELKQDLVRRPSPLGGRGLALVEAREHVDTGGFDLAFAAPDQPGMFSAISGVLSLHGLNVLSADAFTLRGGRVLDVFLVDRPPDALYLDELWGRITGAVRYALTGKLALDWRIARKRNSPLAPKSPAVGPPPKVELDNEYSGFTTVVEVSAADRPGLLYDITKALDDLMLSVVQARIDTRAGRARDVFHVKTALGEKVEDGDHAREIKRALEHALAQG